MPTLLASLVATSRAVGETRSRLKKAERLADLLGRLAPDEVEVAVAYLAGEVPGGRLNVGPALLRDARPGSAAGDGQLGLLEVQRALRELAATEGPGSKVERTRLLADLLARATSDEQEFLARLALGEVRQGALEGVMAEAIARAAQLPAADVRRAAMLAGDLPAVARAALAEGATGLARFKLRLFRPIQPMLAQTAEDVGEALEHLERATFEWKMDGARVQVHKSGGDVQVFTRGLNDVTAAVPEVVELCAALPARELVLDGEVLALAPDGRPRTFQTTMRRFGRKLDVDALRAELPLSAFFFDLLFLDGDEWIDRSASERFDGLAAVVPEAQRMPSCLTADPDEAAAFLAAALTRGHEGVMAKDLAAAYEAGGRGRAWLKIKHVHTLDLVVLAAEWGSGRRRGKLSNLHLGARDPATGGYVMLGKTFKGLTDKMLAWQTERLLELEIGRDEHVVHVEPKLVAEIAFNELQASSRYPGGLALRFARVKRYRDDKGPEDADTIEAVRRLAR